GPSRRRSGSGGPGTRVARARPTRPPRPRRRQALSLCLQPRQRRASVRAAQVGATVWASAGGSASRNGTARVEPIAPAARGAGEGGRVMAWLNVLGLIFNLVGSGIAPIAVIASRAAIDRMTASYYGGSNPDAQADRRRQSNLGDHRPGHFVHWLRVT